MQFTLLLCAAGLAAGAAFSAPQITQGPSTTAIRKRADVEDASYLSAASSLCASNNWDCCSQTTGPLPAPTPDTPDAFKADPAFSSLAANAPVPTGYTSAFTNAGGSIQASFGYRGQTQLSSYDPSQCAAFCNEDNYCLGFNIYVERFPTLRPAYSVCTNPESTGNIGCTRWGYPINAANATNDGSWLASFRVAVTASNGYNRNLNTVPNAAIPDFTGPTVIDGAAIQADGYYQYIDHTDQSAFDPATCAKDCLDSTSYNKAHSNGGPYTACNTFNAFIPLRNGLAQGTRCVLYNQIVTNISDKATNTGENQGSDVITIGESRVYTLTNPDNGGQ